MAKDMHRGEASKAGRRGNARKRASTAKAFNTEHVIGKQSGHRGKVFHAVEAIQAKKSAARQAVAIPDRKTLVVLTAKEIGLLSGETTRVAGRMHEPLLVAARERTGIQSDTELLEYALARVALEDTFAETLVALRGSVSPDVDLEF